VPPAAVGWSGFRSHRCWLKSITCGNQVIQGDGLRAAVIAAMPSMDPPLAQLLPPLLHCGEPVRVKLAAHPEPELMCILDVLEPVG
jgi:hypothetical protein